VERLPQLGHNWQAMKPIQILKLCLFLPFAFSDALAEECHTVNEKPGVTLKRCDSLHVLFLEGTPVLRARAAGELLRGPLSPAVVNYFDQKILDAVPPNSPWLEAGFNLIYNQIVRLLHRRAPKEMVEELDALAAGMGREGISLRRAVTLADTSAALNALGSLGPFRSLPAAGCTSVAQRDENGNFVYGRNLDFAGTELWDKHPLLLVMSPPPGGDELKHLVFGADGAIFGGITGANEAGITFAVQQNYSRDGGLSGVPMMFIGELVLRRATNLAEAEVILRKYRPALLWTFLVSDLKTGEIISVESSRRNFSVRRMESPSLVQTNHVMSESIKGEEFISLGTKINSIYRMKKAFATLETKKIASMATVAQILGHQANPAGEMQPYHDVMKAHTIQTVIFDSHRGVPGHVYVSIDPAPTASGRFAQFEFKNLFEGAGSLGYKIADPNQTSPAKRERQREISLAFSAYFDEKNLPKALSLLEKHQTFGAQLFRAVVFYQQEKYLEAINAVDFALKDPRHLTEPTYIRQSFSWVKLAALLALGGSKKEEAKSLAARLVEEGPENQRLSELASAVASGKDPHHSLLRLTYEFFSGDIGGRAQ
jgi:hypothetical protein